VTERQYRANIWVMPMEESIHQQNLERYRKMLSEKTHEPQRQTIVRLLADEETREDRRSKLDTLRSIVRYWPKADLS
jgi:hypothetical protein